MASTINLQASLKWCNPYVHFQPLEIGDFEPVLTNFNLIKSTMLGAPMVWPWNRAESAPFVCVVGQQDYPISLPAYGFAEKAWLVLGDETKEIGIKRSLSKSSKPGRPESISLNLDDGAGNLTFRLSSPPDETYAVTIQYQEKAEVATSTANRWDPIPDELSYIFHPGFLAMNMLLTGDARFPIFNDRFIAHLLGTQDGMDETQKNIFIETYLGITRQMQRSAILPQQGIASRAK